MFVYREIIASENTTRGLVQCVSYIFGLYNVSCDKNTKVYFYYSVLLLIHLHKKNLMVLFKRAYTSIHGFNTGCS